MKKILNEIELKKCFVEQIRNFYINDENKVEYSKSCLEYYCSWIENSNILKEKVINVVNLINKIKDTDEYNSFKSKDIENEVWDLV